MTTIRNGLKRIIPASGRLGLLQMISEQDIMRCASENADPQGAELYKSVKTMERYVTHAENRQCLLALDLSFYIQINLS